MNQEVCIPPNRRGKVGVDLEVETEMSQLIGVIVFHALVSCHLEASQKLAIHDSVFDVTVGELFELIHTIVQRLGIRKVQIG